MAGRAANPVAGVEQGPKKPREQEEHLHPEGVDGGQEKVEKRRPKNVPGGAERDRGGQVRDGRVQYHPEEHGEPAKGVEAVVAVRDVRGGHAVPFNNKRRRTGSVSDRRKALRSLTLPVRQEALPACRSADRQLVWVREL